MKHHELKHNTEALQERHREVYDKFFAENDLVLSSPMWMCLATGLAWRAGAPQVAVKMPFRIYLGITKKKEINTISFGTPIVYDSGSDQLKECESDFFDWDMSGAHLKNYIQEVLGQSDFQGIEFNFLMEESGGRGCSFGYTALVIYALQMYYNYIDPSLAKEIRNLSTLEIAEGTSRLSQIFTDISINTTKLSAINYHYSVSGSIGYSLLNSESPLVYFNEERAGSVSKRLFELPPLNIQEDLSLAESWKFWGYRMEELVDGVSGPLPLDVVGIHVGRERQHRSTSEHVDCSVIPSFDRMRDKVKEAFKKVVIEDENHAPAFLKKLDIDGLYWQRFARGQVYARVALFIKLHKLYKDKESTSCIIDFLGALDSMETINAPFEEGPSKNIQVIARAIKEKARERGVDVALRIQRWGKMDGDIFVVTRRQSFRKVVFEIVEELQETHNARVHVNFASFRDGWEESGAVVEQFLSKSIHSEFVEMGACQLIECDEEGVTTRSLETSVDPAKYNLFFDEIKKKIYVGGEAVTSKDLPSQKASIEIFEALIENIGASVWNTDLPRRTYSGYRNEFQGKIVGPLEKVMQEKINISLGVTLNGQLSKYQVCWEPKGITIGFLREI
jgi:hypothetical protein